MRNAVNGEYMRRRDEKLAGMNARIDANTNREMPAAPAPEKEEAKTTAAPPKTDINKITPRLGPTESDYGKDMPGWGDTEWKPDGGVKAPGQDEYDKEMAATAKSKAQSYSGSKVDYSFNASGGTAAPSSDVYGNVSPEDAAQNTLSKWKYGINGAK